MYFLHQRTYALVAFPDGTPNCKVTLQERVDASEEGDPIEMFQIIRDIESTYQCRVHCINEALLKVGRDHHRVFRGIEPLLTQEAAQSVAHIRLVNLKYHLSHIGIHHSRSPELLAHHSINQQVADQWDGYSDKQRQNLVDDLPHVQQRASEFADVLILAPIQALDPEVSVSDTLVLEVRTVEVV